ncbi:MAG TPA: proprotein convertase P-domain-containing protein [Myxococcota bacterium]|nr:proprotein convertase P-domain-containing protein [Myxococcota bacterium]HRY91830.1 proprotein convertase P-domain-containing protein [Myxococcota bacterium]HSA23839.1 proprotein convertase P-domain-containing protein [Myxococcota bacterium]
MKKLVALWLAKFLAIGLAGCSGESALDIPSEDEDLVASFDKEDTGYLSDQATEMEGMFVAELRLDTSSMDPASRDTFVSQLRGGSWSLRSLIGDQIKFGKNQLNTEKLHMNLSAQDIVQSDVLVEGTLVRVPYALRIETIVSFEELRAAGIEPDTLTERAFPVKLPADHRDIFARVSERCAEGFTAGDLADYNYFSYFTPAKAGCDLDLVDATFTLNSLLPRKTTYPEYHRLVADGQVTVAVFFGAAGHEETVPASDEGVQEWNEFVSALKSRGFKKTEDLQPKGARYTRTKAGLLEIVDVVSPYDLHSLQSDTQGLFRTALRTHEVMVYDGHSFYGSLSVLGDKDAYPADTYQVLFMNSCWSYEYYTKQVFQMKATAADPSGWSLADVVNDTESGWFTNMAEETRILLTNLLAGCESGGQEGTRQYTWDAIIEAMNKHALDRYRAWGMKSHEIYGVSGVRTNCYDPQNPESCKGERDDTGGGESVTHTASPATAIPDNDPAGVRSTLSVPEQIAFTGLVVQVDLTHTFVGDLVIELEHAGKRVTLQSREGGSQQDLIKEWRPIGFDGTPSTGDWTLIVTDLAARDAGTLRAWTLTLSFQGEVQDPVHVEAQPGLDIPDNAPGGVSSSLEVTAERDVRGLQVEVDITHTYVGDLVVTLEHGGKTISLQDRAGGSAQDLVRQFSPVDFEGLPAAGTWTLKVVDTAAQDVGRLNRWALTIGG